MPDHPHYSMLIRWSEEDEAYLVALPEWRGRLANWMAATHGDTYEEAARVEQLKRPTRVAQTPSSPPCNSWG